MINPKDLNFENWGYGPTVQPSGQAGKKSITRKPTGEDTTIGINQPSGSVSQGGGTEMPMEDFQYPSEWDQAGNAWGQMASGNYSNPGMDYMNNLMGSGGNAFDVSGWDAMYRPQMMDQYSNAVRQMAEQAGMGGVRYGSGLQNSIANYGGQMQNQYTKDLWDRMYGAYESGQNRAYGAAGAYAPLALGAKEAGAEGLLSLGNYRSQLPLQVASGMFSGANALTEMQVDPWTQMMANYIGPTGQAVPQTYSPSALQSFFGNAGQGAAAGLKAYYGG